MPKRSSRALVSPFAFVLLRALTREFHPPLSPFPPRQIRRASCKVLSAIIATRSDLIPHLFKSAVPQLIPRFNEREESVRLDIFAVGSDLAKASTAAAHEGKFEIAASGLPEALPAIVAGVVKQLNGKSAKTKIAAFALLSDIVDALHVRRSPIRRAQPPPLAVLLRRRSAVPYSGFSEG